MQRTKALAVLQDQVHERAEALRSTHPGWPCQRGCDLCCRKLARVPELTDAEWEVLSQAFLALPESEQRACLTRAERLAEHVRAHAESVPVECPLLDPERGQCRVYSARPLACRSYGFYVSHSHDAWCTKVSEHVAGVRDGLIFGNETALERELSRWGGETRDLLTRLAALSAR